MNHYGTPRRDVITFSEARAALGLSAAALRAALSGGELVVISPVKVGITKAAITRLGGTPPARSNVTDVVQRNDCRSAW